MCPPLFLQPKPNSQEPSPIYSLGSICLDHQLHGRCERREGSTIEKGWHGPSPTPECLSGQAFGLPLGLLPFGPGKFILHPHPYPPPPGVGTATSQNPEQTPLTPQTESLFLTPIPSLLANVLISCCKDDIFLRRLTMGIFISSCENPTPVHKDMLWPYDPNNTIEKQSHVDDTRPRLFIYVS